MVEPIQTLTREIVSNLSYLSDQKKAKTDQQMLLLNWEDLLKPKAIQFTVIN